MLGLHLRGCEEGLSKPESHGIGDPFLFRAGLTQVHCGHLPVDDLGKEDRGLFAANVALH